MHNEKITSITPYSLTIIVVLLLVLRIAVCFFETYRIQPPEGIKWQGPSRADLAGVQDYKSKMIFYYFCEPRSESCRRVDHGALISKSIVKLVNDKFLPIKILNDQNSLLIKELKERFGVLVCPTFVVTLPSGSQIGTQTGYLGINTKNLLLFIESCIKQEKYVEGLDFLALAEYEEAAEAFKIWLEKNGKSEAQFLDATLYCALAELMLFKEADAKQLLEKIKDSQYEKDSYWPQPLVAFLSGTLDAENLLQECQHEESKQAKALYFMGMLELRNGNLPSGIYDFRQAEKLNDISSEIRALIMGQLYKISKH